MGQKFLSPFLLIMLVMLFIILPANSSVEKGQGQGQGKGQNLFLGLGNINKYVGTVQVDDEGRLNEKLELAPFLSLGLDVPLGEGWRFIPELGLEWPRKARDPEISRLDYFVLLPLGYRFDWILLKGGFGFFFSQLSGSGGTKTLRNGKEKHGVFFTCF